MKWLSRLCAPLLAAVLILPGGALAASWPDLTPAHWAWADMERAASLGIIYGMDDGRMAPDETLTWGQYLVMLGRVLHPEAQAACSASGLAWDQAGYQAALDSGLLLENDFLPVTADSLSQPILRQDAAVLLSRVLPEDDTVSLSEAAGRFSDWALLESNRQVAVAQLSAASIVRGREDGTFGGGETIRRCDGSVLLLRTMDAVDSGRRGESVPITLHVVDLKGNRLCEDIMADARVGSATYRYVEEDLLPYYRLEDYETVSSFRKEYRVVYRPYTQAEIDEAKFWDQVNSGQASYEDYSSQSFHLHALGENSQKHLLLFGDEEKRRFDNREEAAAAMTTVTIPVWRLNRNGNKVSSTASLSVHAALADDVVALFTEIYEDPEQFPIQDIGGYSWRGDSATGEHNCGTAIDINSNQNYQVRDGAAMAGSYWRPGEDPLSIPADGSVVRIFAQYGWSWGGDAWAYDSDQSTGYHDYMHFSYMGG